MYARRRTLYFVPALSSLIVQVSSGAAATHERMARPLERASAIHPVGALPDAVAAQLTVMRLRVAVRVGVAGVTGANAPHAVMQVRPVPPGLVLRSRSVA